MTTSDVVLSKLIPNEVRVFVRRVDEGTMPVFDPHLSTLTVHAAAQYTHVDTAEAFALDGPGEAMLLDLAERCGLTVGLEVCDDTTDFVFGIDPKQTDRFSQASAIAMDRIGLIRVL